MKCRAMQLMWGLFVMACAGCGGDGSRVPAWGTVVVHGQAVVEGSINFRPAPGNAGAAAGTRITNGSYRFSSADGPNEGRYIVEVTLGETPQREPFGRSSLRESFELDCEVMRDDPQIDIALPAAHDTAPGG